MNLFRLAASSVMLVLACSVQAQCDPEAVDFGEATWGLSPDGETTFFDTAYVSVAYADEVHLLVPSFAIDVVPDTPLNAPIDSVVIEAVLLVDTVAGDTLTFEDAGLEYVCNNNGDCADPCTFLGGGQYCASFSGVPTVVGSYVLSMEVNVWATVFGFPLATPFSFDGFPFPILDQSSSIALADGQALTVFPTPAAAEVTLSGAQGATVALLGADGRLIREWTEDSNQSLISVEELNDGVYFLRIQREGEAQVRRLLVQR